MKLVFAMLACVEALTAQPACLELERSPRYVLQAQLLGQNEVRGSVCRRAFATPPPRYVRMERLSADGALVDAQVARIRGMPGYRGGCGFFSFEASSLGPGDRVRLAASRGRA